MPADVPERIEVAEIAAYSVEKHRHVMERRKVCGLVGHNPPAELPRNLMASAGKEPSLHVVHDPENLQALCWISSVEFHDRLVYCCCCLRRTIPVFEHESGGYLRVCLDAALALGHNQLSNQASCALCIRKSRHYAYTIHKKAVHDRILPRK